MNHAELKEINFNSISLLTKNDACLEMLNESYYLPLKLSIGMVGEDGSDYFDVDVFNVGWVKKKEIILMKNSIVVDLMDFDKLEKYIKEFVGSVSGENWIDIVNQLRNYFYWEYEDYK